MSSKSSPFDAIPTSAIKSRVTSSSTSDTSVNPFRGKQMLPKVKGYTDICHQNLMSTDKCRLKLRYATILNPIAIHGIERMDKMNILGITVSHTLTFHQHIAALVTKTARSFYALKTICTNGLNGNALWVVTRATLVSQLLYASQTVLLSQVQSQPRSPPPFAPTKNY